ncbi:hypothetical protein KEM54_004012, partial [Ascosphaera aggregata]
MATKRSSRQRESNSPEDRQPVRKRSARASPASRSSQMLASRDTSSAPSRGGEPSPARNRIAGCSCTRPRTQNSPSRELQISDAVELGRSVSPTRAISESELTPRPVSADVMRGLIPAKEVTPENVGKYGADKNNPHARAASIDLAHHHHLRRSKSQGLPPRGLRRDYQPAIDAAVAALRQRRVMDRITGAAKARRSRGTTITSSGLLQLRLAQVNPDPANDGTGLSYKQETEPQREELRVSLLEGVSIEPKARSIKLSIYRSYGVETVPTRTFKIKSVFAKAPLQTAETKPSPAIRLVLSQVRSIETLPKGLSKPSPVLPQWQLTKSLIASAETKPTPLTNNMSLDPAVTGAKPGAPQPTEARTAPPMSEHPYLTNPRLPQAPLPSPSGVAAPGEPDTADDASPDSRRGRFRSRAETVMEEITTRLA